MEALISSTTLYCVSPSTVGFAVVGAVVTVIALITGVFRLMDKLLR